ncbi:hypothetical protein [Ferrovibrio sp.]|uniref:DODA-type extradiol aromatic ring-opening family dioxygenase n=1 Tax=Ferrovibrio sp. TaxID=1917215 RepID=UPI00261E89AC|nr:hypothetical protein [Ferrovibrio sp.]
MTQQHQIPSQIVAALSMTHTPGLGDRMGDAPKEQAETMQAAFAEGRELLAKAKPDVIIAFVNDHFDMYSLENMPTFSVCVADTHYGPPEAAEKWLQMKRRSFKGHADYSLDILKQSIADGFDMARSGSAEFVHNVLIPVKYLMPDCDIPVVPVFVNCFAPPLPSFRRCYELGELIGKVIAKRPEKVALIASGGISHWPPFVKEDEPNPDDLARRMLRVQQRGAIGRVEDPGVRVLIHEKERELAASDREMINIQWDKDLLDGFARGDKEYFTSMTYDEIERLGGNGGHEMCLWVALMAALGGAPSRTLVYEPVKAWMGGVGVISYDQAINGKSA